MVKILTNILIPYTKEIQTNIIMKKWLKINNK